MRPHHLLPLVILLLFMPGSTDTHAQQSDFTPTDCPPGITADQCALVTVPQDHADPTGPTLQVAVALYTAPEGIAATVSPRPPLVMLAGDAGHSTLATLGPALARRQLDALRAGRDVILIDQRGTRFSNPILACPENERAIRERLRLPEALPVTLDRETTAATRCAQQLQAAGIDLSVFNRRAMAADVVAVLDVLGYVLPVDLYAADYGTRIAFLLVNDYANRFRAVVLDAVLPPGELPPGAADAVKNWWFTPDVTATNALNGLLAACATDAACTAAFPDLDATLQALITRLDATPATVPVRVGQETVILAMDGVLLRELLVRAMADSAQVGQLPALIDAAATGNFLIAQLVVPDLLTSPGAIGVFYSVWCADGPYPSVVDPVTRTEPPFFISRWQTLAAVCAGWPGAAIPAPTPTATNVPTLIFAGEHDPFSPPTFAAALAETLPGATVVQLPGTGHGQLQHAAGRDCPQAVMLAFLANPTTALQLDCVREMTTRFRTTPMRGETLVGGQIIAETARFRVPTGWQAVQPGFYTAPDGSRALLFFDFDGSDPLIALQNTAGLTVSAEPVAVLNFAQQWDIYTSPLTPDQAVFIAFSTPGPGRSYALVYVAPRGVGAEAVPRELAPILASFGLRPPRPTPTPPAGQ